MDINLKISEVEALAVLASFHDFIEGDRNEIDKELVTNVAGRIRKNVSIEKLKEIYGEDGCR